MVTGTAVRRMAFNPVGRPPEFDAEESTGRRSAVICQPGWVGRGAPGGVLHDFVFAGIFVRRRRLLFCPNRIRCTRRCR